jgi:hypothetical protein
MLVSFDSSMAACLDTGHCAFRLTNIRCAAWSRHRTIANFRPRRRDTLAADGGFPPPVWRSRGHPGSDSGVGCLRTVTEQGVGSAALALSPFGDVEQGSVWRLARLRERRCSNGAEQNRQKPSLQDFQRLHFCSRRPPEQRAAHTRHFTLSLSACVPTLQDD